MWGVRASEGSRWTLGFILSDEKLLFPEMGWQWEGQAADGMAPLGTGDSLEFSFGY